MQLRPLQSTRGKIGSGLIAAAGLVGSALGLIQANTSTSAPQTKWTDTSYYQRTLSNAYPYDAVSFRTNDGGSFTDPVAGSNLTWSRSACSSGRVKVVIAYLVYRPGQDAAGLAQRVIGAPFPCLVVMIDVESWAGAIRGNQSAGINAQRAKLVTWLGDSRRVIGYGNYYDLAALWPSRGNAKVIVADYSSNSDSFVLGRVAGAFARQYTSSGNVAPFGKPVDVNRFPGTVVELQAVLGLPGLTPGSKPTTKPPTTVKPAAPKPTTNKPAAPKFPLAAGQVYSTTSHNGKGSVTDRQEWRLIKRKLRVLGYGGPVDVTSGYPNPPTVKAIVRFQRDHHLSQTEAVGAVTWRAMFA